MGPQVEGLDVQRHEQTHTSWVYLTEDEAWKIKKPVDLGFLDFSTPELRRRACEREVELNRRLSTDVYHGVVPLGRGTDGRLRAGAEPPVEWAVRMRRLADEDRASDRLARGRLRVEDVDRVAQRIAAFHATCALAAAEAGRPEVVAHNIIENFAQADDCPSKLVGLRAALEVEAWQLSWMQANVDVMEARIRDGYVRDGHGDLRLEHVYFDGDRVQIIDCIEFNERFRYADTAADIAFLSMDLARSQRADLAERLLATYARATGDYGLYRVIDFYESYRAFVRGKICCMALRHTSGEAERHAGRMARNYFLMAQSCGRPALLPPRVVAVGGLIGAGKSTVADWLSLQLGAPTIEADRTRKQLLDVAVDHDLSAGTFAGAYAPEMTERVYDELMARAEPVLGSGRSVVLDATFRTAHLRDKAAALAHRHGVPFTFIECVAPVDELRRRLTERSRTSTASDAQASLLDTFLAEYEAPRNGAIQLDTTGSIEQVRSRASALVGR